MHIAWNYVRRGGAAVSVACLLWIPASSSVAATAPQPDFSLTISPTRLVVPPGQIGQPQHVKVYNNGRAGVTVNESEEAFVQLTDGAPSFEANAPYSAVNWVAVTPGQFYLAPGQSRQITVQITVPANPEAGEHQLVLISSVAAAQTGPNIRINRGVGVAVYITVPGPVVNSVQLTGLKAPGFALGGPINLTATVQDAGTVHRDFSAPAQLAADASGANVKFPDFLVVRGATRVVSTQWANPPFMCICHATVTITNAAGQTSSARVTVVVFPLQLFGALVAAILALLLLRRLMRRRFRNRVTAEVQRLSGEDE